MLTIKEVVNSREVENIAESIQKLGYIECDVKHMKLVSERAGEILTKLGYQKEKIELAKITGYMHDIGWIVNGSNHAQSGAILAYSILKDLGMSCSDRIDVIKAIGMHEEKNYVVLSDISAALILADASEVGNVIKNASVLSSEDKQNYVVLNSDLLIDEKHRKIKLDLTIDVKRYSLLAFFEIFMDKAMISKKAAEYLKASFELVINDTKLL